MRESVIIKTDVIEVVTHIDLDGEGSPILIQQFFPHAKVNIHRCVYHSVECVIKELLDRDEFDLMFITDISFKKESGLDKRIDEINSSNTNYDRIMLIDHHSTSQWLNKYQWAWSYETDPDTGEKKCGTQWTYEFLKSLPMTDKSCDNHNVRKFVELVNLWDTWRWVDDYPDGSPKVEAKWLNMLLTIRGKEKFYMDFLYKFLHPELELINEEDKRMIDNKEREIVKDIEFKEKSLLVTRWKYRTRYNQLEFIRDYLESSRVDKDMSYLLDPDYSKVFKIGVVFIDRNISDVCNELANNHPELDFIMGINFPRNISLRSTKDLDVPLGIVANNMTGKGGGHPRSAGGCVTNHEFVISVRNAVFNNLYNK